MKVVFVGLFVLIVGGTAWFMFSKPVEEVVSVDVTNQRVVEVVLTDDGYNPSNLVITKGTEVVFRTDRNKQHWPASNIHPSHNIYSEFDPKRPLEPDEEWSFIFERVGEWGMHDHIRSYYVGKVKVVE